MALHLLKPLDDAISSKTFKPQSWGRIIILSFTILFFAFSNKGYKTELQDSYFMSQIRGFNDLFEQQFLLLKKETDSFSDTQISLLGIAADGLRIISIQHRNESVQGTFDGLIIIEFEDDLKDGTRGYDLIYDYLVEGNQQIVKNVPLVNGRIVVEHILPGNFFFFRLKRRADNFISDAFTEGIRVEHGRKRVSQSAARATCPIVNFTDCFGTFQSINNLDNNNSYNINNSYRPCGFSLNSSCQVIDMERWHCIEGRTI